MLVTVDGWWDPKTGIDSIPPDFVPNALRLADAMTPCPQVRPAVCSILSGSSPVETGVRDDVTAPLPATVPLVSERLTEKGWRTAAFIADPRIGNGSGLERGFEVFDPPREFLFGPFRRLPRVRDPGEVVSDFSTWVDGVPAGAPFFAWVHLSRPMVDSPLEEAAEDIGTALLRLSKLLTGSARLRDAAVVLVGIAGQIDLENGENSGYFLNSAVLRVPVLVRSGSSGGGSVDPRSAFNLAHVANWIANEAGIEAVSKAPTDRTTPLLAWTWRGRNEFGWPVEIAAQRGSALCIRTIPGSEDRCVPWDAARSIEDVDRLACAAALEQGLPRGDDPLAIPSLPAELAQQLKNLGLHVPAGTARIRPSVSRELRERAVPSITRARRFADHGKAFDADREYQTVHAADPGNFGALIEAGESLALDGRSKPAKARLEPALRAAPWNPDVWHWLGHVSALEENIDRAETQWRVSDLLAPQNGDVLYDLACARSLAGDSPASEAYLRLAWKAGYRDVTKIQTDPDLRNLRADPAFLRYMREVAH